MRNFLLELSASQMRKITYQEKEVNILCDIFPALMAYSMYADGCPDGSLEVKDKTDEYYRTVSGLSIAKWKKAKSYMKRKGWVSYDPQRSEEGQFEKWIVKIHPGFMSFYTKFEQAQLTVIEPSGTESIPVDEPSGTVFHPVDYPPGGKMTPFIDNDNLSNDNEDLGIGRPDLKIQKTTTNTSTTKDISGFSVKINNPDEESYFGEVIALLKSDKNIYNYFLANGDMDGEYTLDQSMDLFLRGLYQSGKTFNSTRGLKQLIDHHLEFYKGKGRLIQPSYEDNAKEAARLEELFLKHNKNSYFKIRGSLDLMAEIEESEREHWRRKSTNVIEAMLNKSIVRADKFEAMIGIMRCFYKDFFAPATAEEYTDGVYGWFKDFELDVKDCIDRLWDADEDYRVRIEKFNKKYNKDLNEWKDKF